MPEGRKKLLPVKPTLREQVWAIITCVLQAYRVPLWPSPQLSTFIQHPFHLLWPVNTTVEGTVLGLSYIRKIK